MSSDRPSLDQSANAPSDSRAREDRKRVFKGAAILTGMKNSEITCVVRNMHVNGAQLKVPPDIVVPREFLLYVPLDGIAYRCTLRWRAKDLAGVAISGTAPKPPWHYG